MQPKVFKLLFIAERRKIVEGPNFEKCNKATENKQQQD